MRIDRICVRSFLLTSWMLFLRITTISVPGVSAWQVSCSTKMFHGIVSRTSLSFQISAAVKQRQERRRPCVRNTPWFSAVSISLSSSSSSSQRPSDPTTEIEMEPSDFPPGIPEGIFFVVKQYQTPSTFDVANASVGPSASSLDRLQLSTNNVTLPVALVLMDRKTYPSLSKARKACRQKSILISSSSKRSENYNKCSNCNANNNNIINRSNHGNHTENAERHDIPMMQLPRIGRVGDRIYPGDILYKQIRLSHGNYSTYICIDNNKRPSFELPVIYEDQYLAVVNKPAGILVYGQDNSRGLNTIQNALPYFLQSPSPTVHNPLLRPTICHRLDKPTCGLLLIAKTRPAAIELSRQFEERLVQKTYTAFVNGRLEVPTREQVQTEQVLQEAEQRHHDQKEDSLDIPSNLSYNQTIISSLFGAPRTTTILPQQAYDMGMDVDPFSTDPWQLAECILNNKTAVTLWRVLKYQKAIDARNQTITVVELKPKTGRYHQLRRQMAWMYNCPILGDRLYGNIEDHANRWPRGLFLCSSKVRFDHPINSKTVIESATATTITTAPSATTSYTTSDYHAATFGDILSRNKDRYPNDRYNAVSLSIDLPAKFHKFLESEEINWNYHRKQKEVQL